MRLSSWLRRPVVWLPISIGLIGLLIWRARPWEAAGAVGAVDPLPLIVAAALCAVVATLWALRSSDLLAGAGQRIAVGPLIPMTAFANTINNLTPGSAGEVVRMYLLRAHHRVDYATSAAVIFVERVGAMGYLTTSALLAWATWLGIVPAWLAAFIAVLLVAGPVVVYRAGLRPLAVVRALPAGAVVGLDRWDRAKGWLGRVDDATAQLVGRPRRLLAFVAITVTILGIYATQLILVARAFGVTLDPLAAWGALGVAMTVGVLTLLPFGLGTADLTLAGLLGVLGTSPGAALAITLGYRLVSTLPLGIAGVLSYAWLSARLPRGGMADAARAIGSEVADPSR